MNNDICNHTYFQAQAQGQEYGNTAAVAEYINRMMLYDMALPHGVDFSSVIAEDEALLCWLIQQSAGAICREQERIAATGQEIAFLGGTADWLEGELQNTVSPDIRLPQGVRYERLIQNCDGLQYDGDGVLCLSGMAPDCIAAELAVSETILYYAVPVVYEYDGLLYAPAHKYILERESSDCTLRGKVYDGGTSECMGTFEVMSDGTIDMVTDSFVPTTEVFVLEEDAESELGYYLETVCS